MTKKSKIADLSSIFETEDAQDSWVGKRLLKMIQESDRSEWPAFPNQIQVEVSNICNHECNFCAYPAMQRKKAHMPKALFKKVVKDAFDLGAREIGLFAGAEPLTCKWLDEYILFCKDVGFEYQYISTNGALGSGEKFIKLIDAGLSSIKFSVNGGNREVYRKVHGKDDFDKVMDNIAFVDSYRKSIKKDIYLGVSFVGTPATKHTFEELKLILDGIVDEVIYYEASNQSGQMPDLPLPPYRDCHLPFNKAHISVEGYLKACCNDYENYLAIADLKTTSLLEGWQSKVFRELRRKHLNNNLDGTLCANCIRGCQVAPKPLNDDLTQKLPEWKIITSDA